MKPAHSSSAPLLPKLSKSAHRRRSHFNNQLKRLQAPKINSYEDRDLFHFCARTGKLIQRSKPGIVEKEIIPVTDPDLQSLSYQPKIETFLKDPYALINTNPVPSAAPTLKVRLPTYPLPSVYDLDKPLSISASHQPFTSSSA